MKALLLGAALSALASAALAQEETTMTLEEVPQAAMDAAMAQLEEAGITATFDTVAMDDDEGTMTYELSGTHGGRHDVEVDVLEDGTFEELEREIAMDALPPEVTAALEQELPGLQPATIEESTRPDGAVIYEFEGTHEGQEIDAEINADGSGFSLNADTAG
jgi:hypothetical protein